MKKLVCLFTSLIFCLCFITPTFAEENSNDNISAFELMYENIENVTITQNGEDVTDMYIGGFIDVYQSGEEDEIDTYINSNNLNISVIADNNLTRAYEGKIFVQVYAQSGTASVYSSIHGQTFTYSKSWNVEVRLSYTVNVQTEKIGSITGPSISLRPVYDDQLNDFRLSVQEMNATKTSGDTHINIYIRYWLLANRYFPGYELVTFTPPAIQQYV